MGFGSLLLTLPELILSVGALILLLVAAWRGDDATRSSSWVAVALLLVAGLSLIGPAGHGDEIRLRQAGRIAGAASLAGNLRLFTRP